MCWDVSGGGMGYRVVESYDLGGMNEDCDVVVVEGDDTHSFDDASVAASLDGVVDNQGHDDDGGGGDAVAADMEEEVVEEDCQRTNDDDWPLRMNYCFREDEKKMSLKMALQHMGDHEGSCTQLLEDKPRLCYCRCSPALSSCVDPAEDENYYHDETNIEMNFFEKKNGMTTISYYFQTLLIYEYFYYFFCLLRHRFWMQYCSSLIFLFWKYQEVTVMGYQELSKTYRRSEMKMGQQSQLNQTEKESSFDQYLPWMRMIWILGE